MWSWLQKMIRYVLGEEEQEREQELERETVRYRPLAGPAAGQLRAKTKNIYPKQRGDEQEPEFPRRERQRHFRFPVISDEELHRPKKREPVEMDKPGRGDSVYSGPDLVFRSGSSARSIADGMKAGEQVKPEVIQEKRGAEHTPRKIDRVKTETVRREERKAEPLRPAGAAAEKRTYKPSEFISPVYGKMTPSTRETEHRIHTTSGIFYAGADNKREFVNTEEAADRPELTAKAETDAVSAELQPNEPAAETAATLPWTKQEVPAAKNGTDAGEAAEARDVSEVQAESAASDELTTRDVVFNNTAAAEAVMNTETVSETAHEMEPGPETKMVPETDAVLETELVAETETLPETETVLETETTPSEKSEAPMDVACESPAVPAQTADEDADEVPTEPGETQAPALSDESAAKPLSPAWEASAPESTACDLAEQPQAAELEAAAGWTVREQEMSAKEIAASAAVQERASSAAGTAEPSYELPSLDLLDPCPPMSEDDDEHTQIQKMLLEETLANFNVNAQVVGIVKGPSVTRFELQPAPGVKVNKITSLIDDIKLNLAAKDIRIEAPIPGRNAVGIEVPNLTSQPVLISRIIGSVKFREHPSPLAVALGMDIGGEPIVADIKKMPHGLIAGATGSGKSVCINSIIVSLLYKATPEQVRLLLIDPKMVELAPYNHLPHLVTPVVTDAKQATAALKWAVEEMEKRYALFVDAGARDIERYNQTVDQPLPYIVIVIDELADLMMVSPQDVEECIIRIAQKARACGIHLLLATQRPSVDVITGNIKANVPTRLAFAVFSQVDSRTILDQSGAERLLGRGDMLFLESGVTPVRLQGNYVSDDEIERITRAIKQQRKPSYLFSKEELEQQVQSYDMGDDPLYHEALLFVAEQGQASASALQRRFRIGYNRAARLIEMMEADGYVAGQNGGKPRAVLITREDAEALAEGSSLF